MVDSVFLMLYLGSWTEDQFLMLDLGSWTEDQGFSRSSTRVNSGAPPEGGGALVSLVRFDLVSDLDLDHDDLDD